MRLNLGLLLLLLSLLGLGCGRDILSVPRSDDDDAANDDDSGVDDDDSADAADDDDAGDDDAGDDDDADDDDAVEGDCTQPGARTCWGLRHMECVDVWWTELAVCGGETPACHPELGCVQCSPGSRSCEGNEVAQCDNDGMGTTVVDDCFEGVCISGVCY